MNSRILFAFALGLVGTPLFATGVPSDPPPTVVPKIPADAHPTALSDEAVESINQNMALANIGTHWSGLDRAALLRELSSGNLKAAEARIQQSADKGGRDHALCHILLELATTDLFRPYRTQIISITSDLLGAQRNVALIRSSTKNEELLLRGRIQETVLGDDDAAEASYRQVLGDDDANKILGASRPLDAIKGDGDGVRQGAAYRILAIEERKRDRSRHGDNPGEGR